MEKLVKSFSILQRFAIKCYNTYYKYSKIPNRYNLKLFSYYNFKNSNYLLLKIY